MGKECYLKKALHKNITFNDEILNDFLACRYVFIYQSRVADCPRGLCSGRGLEHAQICKYIMQCVAAKVTLENHN